MNVLAFNFSVFVVGTSANPLFLSFDHKIVFVSALRRNREYVVSNF